MTIYLTTDTHFSHKKEMIEYCDRPIDFEERLIKSFCLLQHDDILFHLGDICIGKDQDIHDNIIQKIKAKKILVRGNHDKKSNSWYLRNGWDFVCRHFFDKYHGLNVLFSHRPVAWDGMFDINIHGHLHNLGHRPDEKGNSMNHLISLEIDGYRPLSLRSVLEGIIASNSGK